VKYSRIPSGRLHATFKNNKEIKYLGHIKSDPGRDPKVFDDFIDPRIRKSRAMNPDLVLSGNSPFAKKLFF
jgi:hypothetical protein